MITFLHELSYAFRTLARAPGLTLAAVITLAFATGAATAVFSLLDAVVYRPLPVRETGELVQVAESQDGGRNQTVFSYPFFQYLRSSSPEFSNLFVRATADTGMSAGPVTEPVTLTRISSNYFEVLGVNAQLGRVLQTSDDDPGASPALVVLSDSFWRRRFGARPDVAGMEILLAGAPFTVVGVAPRGFFGVDVGWEPDLWAPLTATPLFFPTQTEWDQPGERYLRVIGRLAPDVNRQKARAAASLAYRRWRERELPAAGVDPAGEPRRREIVFLEAGRGFGDTANRYSHSLHMLMLVAAAVALIAAANVSGLLLVRASSRRGEFAIRAALGAGRARIAQSAMAESFLLSFAGGAAGLLAALFIRDFLLQFLRNNESISAPLDFRVLAFTSFLCLVVGLVTGTITAVSMTRSPISPLIRSAADRGSGGRWSAGKSLVAAQVALTLPLVFGAALLVRTLQNLYASDPGFQTERVYQVRVEPSAFGYTEEQTESFYRRILAEVRALPNITSAALGDAGALSGYESMSPFLIQREGEEKVQQGAARVVIHNISVGDEYFDLLGIRVLAGRSIQAVDVAGSPSVAVVNQRFAQLYVAEGSPLGMRLGRGSGPPVTTIVGVVEDTKYGSLREADLPIVYYPLAQRPAVYQLLYVRSIVGQEAVAESIRAAAGAIDPRIPVVSISSMRTIIDQTLTRERLVASLAGSAALLAAGLAGLGLYGLLAFLVRIRTREVGIRMALGARSSDIVGMVLRESLKIVCVGGAGGVVGATLVGRAISGQLFGITGLDAASLFASLLLIAVPAALAASLPARRAARVEPVVALRLE